MGPGPDGHHEEHVQFDTSARPGRAYSR
ncbi:MAG: hypothetical protein B7Z04_07885 [Rhodobacterales bacterium 32-66-9]|nr:MAG: hypothetical protein B7Z04_07885 [Rhodobacterales bacterium 32-66-9]